MRMSLLNRITEVLLWIVATLVLVFFVMVECFNGPALDDLIFLMSLQNTSVIDFVVERYVNWQGRFTSFFLSGLCLKSYILLGTLLPFTILMFIVNISLWSSAIRMMFDLSYVKSIPYGLILHGLFYLTMFDPSSYFLICTKPYIFIISCSVYGFVKLIKQRDGNVWDYIAVVFTYIFIGASYEIYAPIVLLFIGCAILYLWKKNRFSISQLFKVYPLLMTAFGVAGISFAIMLVAPGNWVRVDNMESGSIDNFYVYVSVIFSRLYMMGKYLFFNLPYILCVCIIVGYLFQKKYDRSFVKQRFSWKYMMYISIALFSLVIISLFLNAWAMGSSDMYSRASNHILLVFYIWCVCIVAELVKVKRIRYLPYLYTFVLLFLTLDWFYIIMNDYKELDAYKISFEDRMEILNEKKENEFQGLLELEPLHIPKFHSLVEDTWCKSEAYRNHTYRRTKLIRPDDVYEEYDAKYNPFNRAYKRYYNLPFDVKTDLPCKNAID